MNTPLDINRICSAFPCLSMPVHGRRLAYLDSASTALKPDCVIGAMTDYYRCYPANIHRGVHALSERATAACEQSRESVRAFLNAASTAEIIFTSGATEGINLVAASFGGRYLEAGDEVLITALEHHANIVPWQLLRERGGIVLRIVPVTPDGDITLDAFQRALSPRTRLVAISALANAIGTVPPLAAMIRLAHAAGAKVLVDAAQAAACMPMDVQALDCDFLVFSGHKLFGPTGIGVLYGRAVLLDAMPPFKGGGDMIRSVTFEKTVWNELPYKFEVGTTNIAGAIGLGAAVAFVAQLGFEALMAHERHLVDAALCALAGIDGVRLVGNPVHRRAIISFTLDGVHPHDAGTLLDEDGVAVRAGHHCAQPLMAHFGVPATVRVAFSIYNSEVDIEQIAASLKRIIKVLS